MYLFKNYSYKVNIFVVILLCELKVGFCDLSGQKFEFVFSFFIQYIQKKDPVYEDAKNDTVWSINKFYEYVYETFGEEKKLPETIGKVIDVSLRLWASK